MAVSRALLCASQAGLLYLLKTPVHCHVLSLRSQIRDNFLASLLSPALLISLVWDKGTIVTSPHITPSPLIQGQMIYASL